VPVGDDDVYASYRRLETPLFNVLYRWLWDTRDCQDLIHDTYLRIWNRRNRIDAQRLDALAWTTALNLARNRLRWRNLWRQGQLDPGTGSDADPLVEAARREDARRLRRALQSLPPALRETLLLAEFGGLTTAEISAVLGIPPGTVGSRKHQALVRLRAALEEKGT
jgi:RNA polymerase sigma-70 factor (ECF subfamily)